MIVVFGSINIDLVTRAKIPAPGETTLGGDYVTVPGGKGANQALAARRAGAQVALVGACGADSFAGAALALLNADGVDLSATRTVARPTGAAFIVVDPAGENAIVVAAGANASARAEQLEGLPFGAGRSAAAAARSARSAGRRGGGVGEETRREGDAEPRPGRRPSEALLGALDYLCVNEHEAATLGHALAIDASEPEGIGAALARRFGFAVIVTLGAAGAVGFIAGERAFAPAPKIAAVDTTAAGDTFVGAFAAARDRGLSFAEAMKRGVVAGSLACAKPGAQTSMPTAVEIDAAIGG